MRVLDRRNDVEQRRGKASRSLELAIEARELVA